jgi:hypothetical protein
MSLKFDRIGPGIRDDINKRMCLSQAALMSLSHFPDNARAFSLCGQE